MEEFSDHRKIPFGLRFSYYVVAGFVLLLPFVQSTIGLLPLMCVGLALYALWFQSNRSVSIFGVKKPAELYFYTAWGVWALMTGLVLKKNTVLYAESARMLVRMLVFIWPMYALLFRQRTFMPIYVCLSLIAVVNVVATAMGYHVTYGAAGFKNEVVQDVIDFDVSRAEGLTGNANSMAFVLLSGIWSCMMLWNGVGRTTWGKFLKVALLGLVVLFLYYTVNTASRKSLLVVVALLFGWFVWMLPGRFSIKSFIVSILLGALALVAFYAVKDYVMANTFAGQRFMQWFDAGGGSAAEGFKENTRYLMYVDGLKIWLKEPLFGVGLGQFGAYFFTGQYSHSDFIEPLACTGLIGFLLYQGFAWIITCRVVRLIGQRNLSGDALFALKGMLLFLIFNHYVIGFGAPHWSSVNQILVLLMISAYSWRVKRSVQHIPTYVI